IEDFLIDPLPLDIGSRPRLAVERAGPPVEHALARVGTKLIAPKEQRLEHIGCRTGRLVEIQRLAETDDQLDSLGRIEMDRVDPAQPLARTGEVRWRSTLAKALEIRARCNEICAVCML